MLDLSAPGYRGLHRNSEVLNKQLHDGRFDMTMHVDPSKRDIVVSRFDAEPRGTWDSEYADPQLERYLDEASRAPDWAAAALKLTGVAPESTRLDAAAVTPGLAK